MKPGAERRPFHLPVGPALAARLAYILIIVFATVTERPSPAAVDLDAKLDRALRVNLTGQGLVDAARNVLLFVGWGTTWVLTAAPGPARPMLLRATGTGMLLSAAVEGAQLFDRHRVASAVDLATNTTGSFLGAFAAVALVLLARAGVGRRSYLGLPALLLAGPYGVAVFLEACFPIFRQARLPGAWGPPGERLAQAFDWFGWSAAVPMPLLELLLFAPAGLLGVAALVELQVPRRRALVYLVSSAAVGFALAELVRGASGYPISATAFALHLAGTGAGAGAAWLWLPAFSRRLRGAARSRAVLLVYGAVIALWVLRPFTFAIDSAKIAASFSSGHLIPLTAYRHRLDMFSTADVAIPAFLLLPVGALLCIWPLRRHGPLAAILPALYLSAVLELGQILMRDRMFDVTDILIATAAAAVGWLVFRRAGYHPLGTLLPARAARERSPQNRTGAP